MQDGPLPAYAGDSGLMTPAETRKALRVGATTLARWARRGDIPSVELPGGHRRYRRTDIAVILAGSTSTTTGAA
ncbi:hypothetical protein FDG2_0446 [Candidatus Protofrankia californiensis]|uniref:Helix-turn-helix domain-containing protein n=1 Tax=Candidatus Protofrankia californiensis TaxID=1839754 RepID=A0A1C3NTJ9_9ACTN|nr:hypothetical protein FDG2_0446 [Candidatus Protofrankia californiensis]